MADIFKFDTVVPIAFQVAAKQPSEPERGVRLACRDVFRRQKVLSKIIPTIEAVLSAGEVEYDNPAAGPSAPHEPGRLLKSAGR
jgi:CRISPR-associated protein Cas1